MIQPCPITQVMLQKKNTSTSSQRVFNIMYQSEKLAIIESKLSGADPWVGHVTPWTNWLTYWPMIVRWPGKNGQLGVRMDNFMWSVLEATVQRILIQNKCKIMLLLCDSYLFWWNLGNRRLSIQKVKLTSNNMNSWKLMSLSKTTSTEAVLPSSRNLPAKPLSHWPLMWCLWIACFQ